MSKNPVTFWRLVILAAALLSTWAVFRMVQVMQRLGIGMSQTRWVLLLGAFGFATLLELVLLGLTWSARSARALTVLSEFVLKQAAARKAASLVFILMLGIFTWFVMFSPLRGFLMTNPKGNLIALGMQAGELRMIDLVNGTRTSPSPGFDALVNSGFQWWFFWILGLAAALVFKISREGVSLGRSLLAALVGQALVLKVFSFLPSITSYPFSLTYSEGSRWYYASLLLAEKIYGHPYLPAFIDLPLDILNAVPFLVGRLPIWVFRLWSASLSLGMTAAVAVLIVRRLRLPDRLDRGLVAAGCILFFFQQGGIYPHLLLAVVVILVGVSVKRPWLSLVSIFLASLWVGMDRINWYPVPGMLAVALFLSEEAMSGYRTWLRYLFKPAIWLVVGIGAAVLGGLVVIRITGNDSSAVTSALSSPLLWYRLFYNPTYHFGVLPAAVVVSLPVWLVLAWVMRQGRWHVLRLLGLLAMLLVLFLGGLVASVKIGGGADLHNLDAYQVMLLLVGVYVYFDRFKGDRPGAASPILWPLTTALLLVPIALQGVQLVIPYDRQAVDTALATLEAYAGQASVKGQVLFISQRQLITFGYVKGIELVPEYENATLTEMVMSNDRAYLDHFYRDLAAHRFSLIVVNSLPTMIQGSKHTFGEENDVWVQRVSQPVLCRYETINDLPLLGLQLLIPRQAPAACP